jgi:hypothetical protein
MRPIHNIAKLQEKNREEIFLSMRRCVGIFKEFVIDDHDDYPKHVSIEGKYIRTQYGCEKDIYYYCFLPGRVQFIHEDNHWRSNLIFFNDKIKCWFVYDEGRKEYVAFEVIDTDAQIAFFRKLDELLYA